MKKKEKERKPRGFGPTAMSRVSFKMRQLLEPEVNYQIKVALIDTSKILKSPNIGDGDKIVQSVDCLQDDLSSIPGIHVNRTDPVECM